MRRTVDPGALGLHAARRRSELGGGDGRRERRDHVEDVLRGEPGVPDGTWCCSTPAPRSWPPARVDDARATGSTGPPLTIDAGLPRELLERLRAERKAGPDATRDAAPGDGPR